MGFLLFQNEHSLLGLAEIRAATFPSFYRSLRLVVFRVNVCWLELLSRCDISTFHTFPNWWCCLSCTRCVCLLLFERVFYSVSISQCLGPPSAHRTASRLIPSIFYFHHLICGFFPIANENIVYSSMILPHHNAFCFSRMLLDLLLFVCDEWTRKAIHWTSKRARLSGDCGQLKAPVLFLHNRSNTVERILEIQNTNEYKSELFSLSSTSMSCWKFAIRVKSVLHWKPATQYENEWRIGKLFRTSFRQKFNVISVTLVEADETCSTKPFSVSLKCYLCI